MFKKILNLIISLGQWLFSKKRKEKKIEDVYKRQKTEIDKAIAGEEDINVVTDYVLGDFSNDSTDGDT